MKILAIATVAVSLSGCSIIKSPSFWEQVDKACRVALTQTPEAIAKAKILGVSVEQIAESLCQVPDVFEPFLREQMTPVEARKATEPAAIQAVATAKAKGLL